MKPIFLFAMTLFSLSSYAQTKFPLQLNGCLYSESFLYEQAFTNESSYYFFNNLGGSVSANYTLLAYNTKGSKAQNNSGALKLQALITSAVYQVQNQSINTLITGGLGIEKNFRFGLFFFGNVQAGLLHSKFYVPVYAVDDQHNLIEKDIVDNYTIAPYSIGFGWNLNRQIGIPLAIKVNSFSFNRPYGFLDYTKNGLMFGLEWRFNKIQLPSIYAL